MRQLLQPIAAFIYCNRQVPPAGAIRPPAAGERRKFLGASRHLRNWTRPWTPPIL